MSLSTSSNADRPAGATFKVGTRQVSPDFTEVGVTCNARDLGAISADQLLELLAKLVAIPADKLIDDDPHLVVGGRRGRFLVRPIRGKVRLFDAENPSRAHLELPVEKVPDYLEGADSARPASREKNGDNADSPALPPARTGLVIFLLILSAAMVGTSAYVTFQTERIDPDSEYSALPADQLATLRVQLPGVYVTGKSSSGLRTLTIRDDGTLTLVETSHEYMVTDKREEKYAILLHGGKTPAARMEHFGPIEIRDARTLFYAGEIYTRQL